MFLPYIAVVGSLAVSTVAQVQQGILDPFAAWTGSFIIVALVGRQVLSLLENASLARHLEARVVERTAELRASEQRFQALVQHSSEVVILVGADGKVEYVSESMTRVVGYSEAHLLGRPLTVARFGGDEFAVLIEDASDDIDVTQVAERVLEGCASRSWSTAASCTCGAAWASPAWTATSTAPTSCCATPTWPCTGPRRPARAASPATTPRCTPSWWPGSSWRPTCAGPWTRASCSCTTSPPSTWAQARSWAPRPWPAGATRPGGWSRRPSSSPWPRPAASSVRW
jgi:PAS fold